MKRISYTEFIDLLTKEPIYFINSFEEAVIRTEIVNKELLYYVRLKGEANFKQKREVVVFWRIGRTQPCH